MSLSLRKLNILRPRMTPVLQEKGNMNQTWYGWFKNVYDTFTVNMNSIQTDVNALDTKVNAGITVVITTAHLTATGTQGSMTFTNGILTAQTPAT